MAQYDVFTLNAGQTNFLYVVDVQHDFLKDIGSRIVVPLISKSLYQSEFIERLNPEFIIQDQKCILSPASVAAVPTRQLDDYVCSLKEDALKITAALDFVFHGF